MTTTTGLAPAPLHMAMRALAALLCLSAASARILEDEIKQLPGWNEALPSRHFSGCEPPPVPPPRLSLFGAAPRRDNRYPRTPALLQLAVPDTNPELGQSGSLALPVQG